MKSTSFARMTACMAAGHNKEKTAMIDVIYRMLHRIVNRLGVKKDMWPPGWADQGWHEHCAA